MKFILVFLISILSIFAQAQINGTNGKISIRYHNNLIKNPSAAANALYTSGTITPTKVSASCDSGTAFQLSASGAGVFTQFEMFPIPGSMSTGQCLFEGAFDGDASLYNAHIVDASGNVVSDNLVLTNETSFRRFVVQGPCGAQGTRFVRFTKERPGAATNVRVCELSYSQGTKTYVQPPNTFTAKVSATGVVSDVTGGDYFTATTFAPTDTSLFTIGLKNLTSAPNCVVAPVSAAIDSAITAKKNTEETSTALVVRTGWTNTSSNFTKQAYAFSISCTKTGADESKPALTVQDMNHGPKDFTMTVAGLGSGSGTVSSATYDRNNDTTNVCFRFVKDGTNGTGVTPVTFSLPTNALPASSVGRTYGSAYFTGAATGNNYMFISGAGATAMTLVSANNTQTGSSISAANEIQACISYKVQGWGAVTVPPIAGAVMAPNPSNLGVKKYFSWTFSGATPATPCSTAGNCTLTNNLDGALTSFVRGATAGVYTANLVPGVCSTVPQCSAMAEDGGLGRRIVKRTSDSWTTTQLFFFGVQTSGAADTSGDIMCTCY